MRRVGAWIGIAVLALCLPAAAMAATSVQKLTSSEIPALLRPPQRGERIIMLWALECVYCEPNMKALAKLARRYPKYVSFVTVSTDSVKRRTAVEARLRHAGVADFPAWAYADATPQRLNYLIDPNWGGEMPRTIVIRADGKRAAASGDLAAKQLRALRPPGK